MYAAARPGRNSQGFGASGNSSADAELSSSLSRMRAASRQMVRDSAYGKRARHIVINNVIGSGVGLEAQVMGTRKTPREDINEAIEQEFARWSTAGSCHTGGAVHFHDLERAAMGEVFTAGEVFIRLHFAKFGRSKVPLALELIEAERLPDGIAEPGAGASGNDVRMGVEVDRFGRAVAYWIREAHPGDIRSRVGSSQRFERVSAYEVMHLRTVDRWPQTRGEPWMHAALRKIDDLNELSGSELQAVRAAAYYFATVETPEGPEGFASTDDDSGNPVMDLEPLTVQQLNPGEKLTFHSPQRPNPQLDAFMRHMVREIAASVNVSYGSLSRDRSQGTYSSERQDLLEDRDTWKTLQQWWIRSFREPLHQLWLQQAVLAGAVPGIGVGDYALTPEKFTAVRFKPRGWSWVDPTKEVTAYKEAIKGGLTTLTDVIAQTADGRGIEDVIKTRQRELKMLEDAGIDVDTTPVEPPEAEEDDAEDETSAAEESGAPARSKVRRIA